ncbi:MAG: hypothetical protein J6R06_08380 [Bacteroidales bacterium]|nr:hypothetical protein [Bacteroidales bacterium]
MANTDFKEYTRMRDIVVKRNKRAVQAGLMLPVHFPTVKEIKSGFVDLKSAVSAVKNYYSSGSQVKTIRVTGLIPPVVNFPVMPKPEKLTEEVKRERKRRQQRDYRRKVKIEQQKELTSVQKEYYKRYIKAVQTMQERGFNFGFDINSLTPTESLALAEYIEFRFAQGDFTMTYVIDEFVSQYAKVKNKYGKKTSGLKDDFNLFLLNREKLSERENKMSGITGTDTAELLEQFIGEL